MLLQLLQRLSVCLSVCLLYSKHREVQDSLRSYSYDLLIAAMERGDTTDAGGDGPAEGEASAPKKITIKVVPPKKPTEEQEDDVPASP